MHLLFAVIFVTVVTFTQAVTDCTCGYYDSSTGNLFTEHLIVYFNETSEFPLDVFSVQEYEDYYEKSWNAIYRVGANASNVELASSHPSSFFPSNTSLQLSLSPSTKNHLVRGGEIMTLRRDIQYGSFRSLIRSAGPWVGGSAMSMILRYNDTQSIQMNVQNADSPEEAWVNMLLEEEFPDRSLGVNFTTILNSTQYQGVSPWDYTEYRYDWTENVVNYYIGNSISRSATLKNVTYKRFPSTPSTLYLKHWSDGDVYAMGGPPQNRTIANLGWTRAFFNTSVMTKADHDKFDARCQISDACSMDDFTLRGHSGWSDDALSPYEPSVSRSNLHMFAVWTLVSSVVATILLLCNVVYQRWPTKQSKLPKQEKHNFCHRLPPQIDHSRHRSGTITPQSTLLNSISSSSAPSFRFESGSRQNITRQASTVQLKNLNDDMKSDEFIMRSLDSSLNASLDTKDSPGINVTVTSISSNSSPSLTRSITPPLETTFTPIPVTKTPITPKKRVDYLAGLISFSTILVTLIHLSFTFIPAAGMPDKSMHYKSEGWALKFISPFLLNQIFVGVFFITSTRFLVEKYLMKGDLLSIAEKTAGRTFRVIIPIAAIAMVEYFLIDCGAIKWLEYLPSVTWSTWPYAVRYVDFSHYISELLELIYLIPNAAPKITYNYCTGVLWTIPVQLQFSWVTLLGAIVIYELKSPYKRGAYYAFAIITNWYAQSWGSFFWCGILLADLEVTYAYKTYLYSKTLILYPILVVASIATMIGLGNDVLSNLTGYSFPVPERGIHPDILTGLPIALTPRAGYPEYFAPRLNGLVFSVGLQVLVELSTWMQAACSIKPFLIIFPHIFTIYLIHGLIFWSLGSAIAVNLNAAGWAYWANILVVSVACYSLLFASLPLLTPVVETLGKNVTANIWTWAHEAPYGRKKTLWPFSEEILFESRSTGGDGDEEGSLRTAVSKGKGKEAVEEEKVKEMYGASSKL